MRRLWISLLLVSALALPASARKSDTQRYRYAQVWSSLVRLLRVDYGFPISEHDAEIGYVLFQYQHAGRSYPGSAELMPTRREGEVRVTIQIPAMPSYIEQMILDRLERKLREEQGEPLELAPEPSRRDRDARQESATRQERASEEAAADEDAEDAAPNT